jgi:hypothetical protein
MILREGSPLTLLVSPVVVKEMSTRMCVKPALGHPLPYQLHHRACSRQPCISYLLGRGCRASAPDRPPCSAPPSPGHPGVPRVPGRGERAPPGHLDPARRHHMRLTLKGCTTRRRARSRIVDDVRTKPHAARATTRGQGVGSRRSRSRSRPRRGSSAQRRCDQLLARLRLTPKSLSRRRWARGGRRRSGVLRAYRVTWPDHGFTASKGKPVRSSAEARARRLSV